MKLYLIRHGQTQMNVDRLYYGWTNCPLNEEGIKQAEELKEIFRPIDYDKIIVSDLDRAVMTADIINSEKQKPVFKNEGFRELHFGRWEGLSNQAVVKDYPEEYDMMKKDWLGYTFPEGESFHSFYNRVIEAYNKLVQSEPVNSSVALVCHNGVISAILCHVCQAGVKGFWKFIGEQGAYSLIEIFGEDAIIRKVNCR